MPPKQLNRLASAERSRVERQAGKHEIRNEQSHAVPLAKADQRESTRGLEDSSRRPKRFRTVRWSVELIEIVLELREQYPRWGKEKLCVLLGREDIHTSASTVGRILKYLKKRELIHDPP